MSKERDYEAIFPFGQFHRQFVTLSCHPFDAVQLASSIGLERKGGDSQARLPGEGFP